MLRDFNTGISRDKKTRSRRKQDIHFINIDLELASLKDLQPLVDELGESVFVLYCDKSPNSNEYLASLEIGTYDIYQSYNDKTEDIGSVDVLLMVFCELLENLSLQSRSLLKTAKNVSLMSDSEAEIRKKFHTQIKVETLKRVSELGASIIVTIYPHLNYEIKPE